MWDSLVPLLREVLKYCENRGISAESLIYRFCRLDRENFGIIKNVTDRLYYTNSYHVHVSEEIDAFEKLKFESQFHNISLGGCISYIEVPNMTNNIRAIEDVIRFIYDNVQYAGIAVWIYGWLWRKGYR